MCLIIFIVSNLSYNSRPSYINELAAAQSLTIIWDNYLPPRMQNSSDSNGGNEEDDHDGDEEDDADESYSKFRLHNDPVINGLVDPDTPEIMVSPL